MPRKTTQALVRLRPELVQQLRAAFPGRTLPEALRLCAEFRLSAAQAPKPLK